jgi:acetyltransferase-like isoleucine patch superfamily enzyme
MSYLDIGDHAFADGPVFTAPSGLFDAFVKARGWRGARRLMAVWDQFRNQAVVEAGVKLSTGARLVNRSRSDRVVIRAESIIRGILRNEKDGSIDIGPGAYVGDGVVISAALEISVGACTLIAHGVQLFDNDTHPLSPEERLRHYGMILGIEAGQDIVIGKAPVRIGRNCWIGMNAMVLKGVSIGDGSVIAAGSLVLRDIPAGVLAAGSPARVIKLLEEDATVSRRR